MQLLERAAAFGGGGAAAQGAGAQKLNDTLPALPTGEPAATHMRMLHGSRNVRYPFDVQCGRRGGCLRSVGGREPHGRANDAAAESEPQGYTGERGRGERSFAAPERYRQVAKRLGMAEDHVRGGM